MPECPALYLAILFLHLTHLVGPKLYIGTKVYQVCYKTKLEILISEFIEILSSLKANCKIKKMRVVTRPKTHVEC